MSGKDYRLYRWHRLSLGVPVGGVARIVSSCIVLAILFFHVEDRGVDLTDVGGAGHDVVVGGCIVVVHA